MIKFLEPATCCTAQSRCLCILPEGHETPHVCGCGGSFLLRENGELVVYALPSGSPSYRLSQEQALVKANEVARTGPLFVEGPFEPLRVSREPIKFFRVPSDDFPQP